MGTEEGTDMHSAGIIKAAAIMAFVAFCYLACSQLHSSHSPQQEGRYSVAFPTAATTTRSPLGKGYHATIVTTGTTANGISFGVSYLDVPQEWLLVSRSYQGIDASVYPK